MFLIGIALFTATSMACGLAPDTLTLQLARVAQGVSAALMVPQVMALVQVTYRPGQRYKVYTIFGFLGGFSAALGPIVGGLLIEGPTRRAMPPPICRCCRCSWGCWRWP